MSRFNIRDTPFDGLKVVNRITMGDNRGFLTRLFCSKDIFDFGFNLPIAQVNHSYSRSCGTLRGMHFQYPPHSEIKLVSCIRGAIWDVVVDLRKGSKTFLLSYAIELSAKNNLALLIPVGFAHGFQTLADDCELIYFHSNYHVPDSEGGINPHDPLISISWPLVPTELSARDSGRSFLDEKFKGLEI